MMDRLYGMRSRIAILEEDIHPDHLRKQDARHQLAIKDSRWAVGEITTLRAELRRALDALKEETQSTERYCDGCASALMNAREEIFEPIDHTQACPIGRLEALLAERQ